MESANATAFPSRARRRQVELPDVTRLLLNERHRLISYLFRLLDDYHEARNVFQETCLVVPRKREAFRPG